MNQNNNPYMQYLLTQNPALANMINSVQQPQQPQQQMYTQDQVNEMIDKRLKEIEQQRNYQVLMTIIEAIIPKNVQEDIVSNQMKAHNLLRSDDLKTLNSLFAETWTKMK